MTTEAVMESELVSVDISIDYGDLSIQIVDGAPIHTKTEDSDGGMLVSVTITETWMFPLSGVNEILTARNELHLPGSEGRKAVGLGVHAECYVSELNRLISLPGVSHEQAASLALCYVPTSAASVIDGLRYGRSDCVAWEDGGTPFPLTSATMMPRPGVSVDDLEVPVYHESFFDIFEGTSIHASMVVSNFVTLETNALRELCRRMLSVDQPGEILEYCKNLRRRVSGVCMSVDETTHTKSVLEKFLRLEVDAAEAAVDY